MNKFTIERIKKIKGYKTNKQIAELFGLSDSDFINRKNRNTLTPLIVEWAVLEKVDLNWLFKEHTDNFKMDLEVITREEAERRKRTAISESDQSNQSTPSNPVETPGGTFGEDVECLRKIYNYGDIGIISAIHQNLKTFVRTVAQDNEIQKLKAENAQIRKRLELLEQKLSTVGRGKVEDVDTALAAGS